jgi:TetR/AcrR family transcriptional repressor of nem operon
MLYRQGYNATSVDDIASAAGVSKSNFYYHFPSKEDLGLAVLSLRREQLDSLLMETLGNATHRPVQRLDGFFSALLDFQENRLERRGCPFGNLVAEMTEHSERMRCYLNGVFTDLVGHLASVIRDGQAAGEMRSDVAAGEAAMLIAQAMQGMLLMVKCDRDAEAARTSGRVLVDLLSAAAVL